MCLAIPGKVAGIEEKDGNRIGRVQFGGITLAVAAAPDRPIVVMRPLARLYSATFASWRATPDLDLRRPCARGSGSLVVRSRLWQFASDGARIPGGSE